MKGSEKMNPEELEEMLNKLNNPELEHTERTEILQTIREENNNVYQTLNETIESLEKTQKEKLNLLESNSQLFRKLGVQEEKKPDEEKETDLSETIKLSDLEKNIEF